MCCLQKVKHNEVFNTSLFYQSEAEISGVSARVGSKVARALETCAEWQEDPPHFLHTFHPKHWPLLSPVGARPPHSFGT